MDDLLVLRRRRSAPPQDALRLMLPLDAPGGPGEPGVGRPDGDPIGLVVPMAVAKRDRAGRIPRGSPPAEPVDGDAAPARRSIEGSELPSYRNPEQILGLNRWSWIGSACAHAALVLTAVAIALTGAPPVPPRPDAIPVTLAFEASAPAPPPSNPAETASAPEAPLPPHAAAPGSDTFAPSPEVTPPQRQNATPSPPPPPKRPASAAQRPRPLEPQPAALAPEAPAWRPAPAPISATGPSSVQPEAAPTDPQAPAQLASLFIPPRPVSGLGSNGKPDYPIEARSRRLQGRVVLRIEVSETGTPVSVGTISSSGHAMLDQAALAAVRGWRFEPATRGGVPIAAPVDIPIDFRMDD